MKYTFLILILFIPLIGFSQMRERLNSTDLKRYEFKGKVREVIHKEYEPIFSNDSTYTLELYDFLGFHNYKFEFNEKGYLNMKTELRKKKDSIISSAVWKYKYDLNNRIQHENRISFEYSKDTMTWNYKYFGDSIVNIQQLDKTYKTLYYTYKQKGDLEYLNHANSDSSYVTKRLFAYDKQNRIVRFEDYENKNYIQNLILTTYKDSTSRNKFKEITIRTKYNNSYYNEFEYDKNTITIKTANFSGYESYVNKHEYTYDKEGNWIEKKIFNPSGKLVTVFKREIKYYK